MERGSPERTTFRKSLDTRTYNIIWPFGNHVKYTIFKIGFLDARGHSSASKLQNANLSVRPDLKHEQWQSRTCLRANGPHARSTFKIEQFFD